jgi:leucine dehydrogenase
MEELIRAWDGETVITRFDRETGTWIFIAIHSTRLGPAGGGTRMKTYPTPADALRDALRLAEGMTYKFAVSGLPRGGGKAVLAVSPDLAPAARADLLRRYGALIAQLGGLFQTGPDVGTTSNDMDIIAETGAPYVFARTPAHGGAGDSGPATAHGVMESIRAVSERLFGSTDLAGRRVLVQGAGSVGARLIADLRAAGAEVLFCDVDAATVARVREATGATPIAADAIYETECEIFVPCALGAILSEQSISKLRCRAVAGSANNQLATPADAERLRERDILYAPDFVVNCGGAMYLLGRELLGWSAPETEQQIRVAISTALREVFARAEAEGITTTEAARRLAEARLGMP